jgi:hypothetical protein
MAGEFQEATRLSDFIKVKAKPRDQNLRPMARSG